MHTCIRQWLRDLLHWLKLKPGFNLPAHRSAADEHDTPPSHYILRVKIHASLIFHAEYNQCQKKKAPIILINVNGICEHDLSFTEPLNNVYTFILFRLNEIIFRKKKSIPKKRNIISKNQNTISFKRNNILRKRNTISKKRNTISFKRHIINVHHFS